MIRLRTLALAAATALALTGCLTSATSSPAHASTPATKVLTIIDENHSLAAAFPQMPYLASLGRTYAMATHYSAIRHPSLQNYLAMTGGSTFGLTQDGPPQQFPINGGSVFGQAIAKHKTAKVYAESMTTACETHNQGRFTVRHTAWPYFIPERALCKKYDVPLGALGKDVASGRLPNLSLVVPNLCNDGHDCRLSVADGWLRAHLPAIMRGPDYRSGRLAIVITFDEGIGANQIIPFVVVHPSLHHVVAVHAYNHYSWTRMASELVGAAPLRGGAKAADLRHEIPALP
jgi:acid phosphatase